MNFYQARVDYLLRFLSLKSISIYPPSLRRLLPTLFLLFCLLPRHSLRAQEPTDDLPSNLLERAKAVAESKPGVAFRYAKEALVGAQLQNDLALVAQSKQLLGGIFYDQGNLRQSLDYYLDALAFYQQQEEVQASVTILNKLSQVYYYLSQSDKAHEVLDEAEQLNQSLPVVRLQAETLSRRGFLYEKEERYQEALDLQQRALVLYQKIEDRTGMAVVFDNIASIYEDLNQFEEAYQYFKRAYANNQIAGNQSQLAMNLNDLGDTFRKRDQYDSALFYTRRAFHLAHRLNQLYQERSAVNDIGETFAKMEAFDSAYYYMFIAQELHKKLYDETTARQVAQMQAVYESEAKNREILAQRVEIQAQRNTQFLLGGAALLILTALGFVYRSNRQKQRTNQALTTKNHRIEEQKKHITDSIRYAQTIQGAVLPKADKFLHFATDYFLIYQPKDIVSGDMFWYGERDGMYFAAVVDCTGHGVPGAFMSMIANTLLNELIEIRGITEPATVLEKLDHKVRKALRQEETDNQDGMDITLARFKPKPASTEVVFASAHQDVFYGSAQEKLRRVRGTRRSVGGKRRRRRQNIPFEQHTRLLKTGDTLYLLTDGVVDQHSASEQKRIGTKQLMEMLNHIQQHTAMKKQESHLKQFLTKHQAAEEQRDDITLLGLRF